MDYYSGRAGRHAARFCVNTTAAGSARIEHLMPLPSEPMSARIVIKIFTAHSNLMAVIN